MSHELQSLIGLAWEGRAALNPANADPKIREAVDRTVADLNAGRNRAAERQGVGQWTVNQWVKKGSINLRPKQRWMWVEAFVFRGATLRRL